MPDPTYEDYERGGLEDLPYSDEQPTLLAPGLIWDGPSEILLGRKQSFTVRVSDLDGYAVPVLSLNLKAPENRWEPFAHSDGVAWVQFDDASWRTPGRKTLVAVAELADGRTIRSRMTITVLDPRPSLSIGLSRRTAYPRQAVLLKASLSEIDAAHGAYVDALEVKWGDGATSLHPSPGGTLNRGSYRFRHRYSKPGRYIVKVRAITTPGWVSARSEEVLVRARPQAMPADDTRSAEPLASGKDPGEGGGGGTLLLVIVGLAGVLAIGYAIGRRRSRPRPLSLPDV